MVVYNSTIFYRIQWFCASTICTGIAPVLMSIFALSCFSPKNVFFCTVVEEGVWGNGRLEGGRHYLESSGAHLHQGWNLCTSGALLHQSCQYASAPELLVHICTRAASTLLHQNFWCTFAPELVHDTGQGWQSQIGTDTALVGAWGQGCTAPYGRRASNHNVPRRLLVCGPYYLYRWTSLPVLVGNNWVCIGKNINLLALFNMVIPVAVTIFSIYALSVHWRKYKSNLKRIVIARGAGARMDTRTTRVESIKSYWYGNIIMHCTAYKSIKSYWCGNIIIMHCTAYDLMLSHMRASNHTEPVETFLPAVHLYLREIIIIQWKPQFSGWLWLSRWPKTKDKHLSRVGSNGSRWRLFLDVRDTVVSCPTRSSTERRGAAMYQGHWDWARPSIGHHWSSVVGPVTNITSIIVYFADIYILDQLWALGKGHEVDPGH